MASDILTATELIAVLTAYCIVFCPILCWAISGSVPFEQSLRSLKKHSRA